MTFDPYFHCDRRDMLVAKDTTDCIPCPMRKYPTDCPQYAHWYKEMKMGKLGYTPEIYIDTVDKPDVTE
jgi:hypothetical protein